MSSWIQSGCQAAVDADHLSMNIHGGLAAEKFDDRGDIVHLPETGQGDHGEDLVFGEIGGHVGFDEAGGDDVDADVSFADFAGEGLAGADQSCLGGGIIDLPGLPNLPGDGGDRDNPAFAGAEHRKQNGIHDVVEAVQIGADDRTPFFGLHPDEKIVSRNSGVENDNGRAGFFGFGAERFFRRFKIGDIEAEEFTFSAEGFYLTGGFLGLLVIAAVGEPDIAAGFGEPEGDGSADSSTAAHDQCNSRICFRQDNACLSCPMS